ncbi:MAG: hypothetical protein GY943_01610 [Chloroflexi bacterium]|nr:hypothetical protein [Chloroflexota bacterium]
MKRIIMLLAAALLLVGCGLDSVPQEGLTNTIGGQSGNETLVATNVKCDVHPLMGSNQAQVSCQLDIANDSMKLGDVLKLHLGGVLATSDSKFIFENNESFSSSGTGSFEAWPAKAWEPEAIYAQDRLGGITLALTAELDGFRSPVEIIGVASMEGAKELNVPTSDKHETSALEISTCEGELISDSSLASITFIGELKDGQKIAGGGLLDTSIMPLDDMCNEVSAEGVVFEIETTDYLKLGDIKGEFKLGIIRDSNTGRPIMLGVVINHEDQYS